MLEHHVILHVLLNGACIGNNICSCYGGWTGDTCNSEGIINYCLCNIESKHFCYRTMMYMYRLDSKWKQIYCDLASIAN